MDAREATKIVREYFDSIKKIKFMFEVRNVEKKSELYGYVWVIKCNIQNVFEEEPISYEVGVLAETREILYVKEIK